MIIILFRDNSHFLRAGGLNPHQETIVFVVVGDDDTAFLPVSSWVRMQDEGTAFSLVR